MPKSRICIHKKRLLAYYRENYVCNLSIFRIEDLVYYMLPQKSFLVMPHKIFISILSSVY